MYVLYVTALENWLKYFKLKQIHIVDSDILRVRPLQVMKQIENFVSTVRGIAGRLTFQFLKPAAKSPTLRDQICGKISGKSSGSQ